MIIEGKEAKEKLLEGINSTANVVKKTLGAKGKSILLIDSLKLRNHITKDGVSVAKKINFDDVCLNAGSQLIKDSADKTVIEAGDGPQPLYSKVLTPSGWEEMGRLKIGDPICGTNGTIQEVIGIYPKGLKDVYKVIFSDGSIVECCEDHLWNVSIDGRDIKTLPLKQIIDKGIFRTKSNGSKQYITYVPNTYVDFYNRNHILDPLLVGLLIGDGSCSENGSVELSLAIGQEHILNEIKLPENIIYKYTIDPCKNYVRVKFKRKNKFGLTMHGYLNKIGLLNKKSSNKFIPREYLYSDYDSRKRLLKGLILTDGHINKRNKIEYSTISKRLALNFVELLKGFGKQVNLTKYNRTKSNSFSNKTIYRITELKGYKKGLKIVDIIKTGKKEEMQCIKVSNPDQLYITDNYIVTHNTTTTTILTQAMCNKIYSEINLGKDSNTLCNDLKNDLKIVKDFISKQSKKIENTEQIRQIAMVSSNSDIAISDMIKEIYDKIGFNGVIDVRENDSIDNKYEIVKGLTIPNTGYSTHLFVNNFEKNRVELNNPKVLVFNGKLNEISEQLMELINENSSQNDKSEPLVLMVQSIEESILNQILLSLSRGLIKNVVVVESNLIYNNRSDRFKDASVFLNAEYTEDRIGKVGYCEKVIIDKEEITFINGKGDITEHLNNLKKIKEKTIDIENRIFSLESNAAIIYVGGKLQTEIAEKKDRIDDAVLAVKSSIEEGFCAGGSSTFLFASKTLKLKTEIMKEALMSCYKQLMINANVEPYYYLKSILSKKYGYGYNVSTNKVENLLEKGIIDSSKVLRVSIENAVYTACTFSLIEAIVE